METLKDVVTGLASKMLFSPEKISCTTPEEDPALEARKAAVRLADCDAWIARMRVIAIAALGQKPFSYDEAKIQKRSSFERSEGAVIAGLPGRGKSMAMAWVIDNTLKEEAFRHYQANDTPFLFSSASALWDGFHQGVAPNPATEWVFLDDWGMEYREPFAISRADEWFRIREATPGVHTWLTTNLSKPQFLSQAGLERIVSRMQGSMDWIEFTGVDRRKTWGK